MRLADSNGYVRVSSFWSAIRRTLDKPDTRYLNLPDKFEKLNPYHANYSSVLRIKALAYISKLTNQEPLPLISRSIFRSPNQYSSNSQAVIQNGHSLPRMFVREKPLVCPECLKESNYIRQIWSFWPYNACHVHNIKLIDTCCCGEPITAYCDYQIGVCKHCTHQYKNLKTTIANNKDLVLSHWLADSNSNLPKVKPSHKYGLILWWLQLNNLSIKEFEPQAFINFFSEWPESFHQHLESKLTHYSEFGLKPVFESTFKDVFGNLLNISAKLPSARLTENIVLTEIFRYFDDNLISENNEFLRLKTNSIEAALLLNTSTEQVAALVENGALQSSIRIKSGEFLNLYQYAFELGDVFCLWQAGYQTEYSNISIITSRW